MIKSIGLRIVFSLVLLLGIMSGTSFALLSGTPLSFEDTVYPTNPYKWNHIFDNTDFTPNLEDTDKFKVTDATLDIQMDFTLGEFKWPGSLPMGFIDVIANGDSLYLYSLDIYNPTPSAVYADYLWQISLGDNKAAMDAIRDKNFTVSLLVNPYFGGSIDNVDSSTLSGTAIVTPEPGTLLLLGSGLIGLGLFGRKRMKK